MSPATRLRCRINGQAFDREIDPRLLLVELVRDAAGLKGTRIGCLTGDCGACTAWLDGRVVKACIVLALSVEVREVTTIEGADDLVHVQDAFVAENGLLHDRHGAHGRRAIASEPAPERRRDPPCHHRQPVPLHRLRRDRGSGSVRIPHSHED